MASAITAVDRLLVEQAKDVAHGDSVTGDFNVESLNSGQEAQLSQPQGGAWDLWHLIDIES